MSNVKTKKQYKQESLVALEKIWNPSFRDWRPTEFLSGLNMIIFDYAFEAAWAAKTKECNNIKKGQAK